MDACKRSGPPVYRVMMGNILNGERVVAMELTFAGLRARIISYVKENLTLICIFLFLFVTGCAAGIRIVEGMGRTNAANMLTALPGILRVGGVPWLPMLLLSLTVHALFAAMLMLAGLWLPTCPLLIPACLLQGLFLGAAIGVGMAAWPSAQGICLLLLLQLEAAALLSPFLRMGVLALRQIAGAIVREKSAPPADTRAYTRQFLVLCTGLLPSVAMQAVLIPAVFALFL